MTDHPAYKMDVPAAVTCRPAEAPTDDGPHHRSGVAIDAPYDQRLNARLKKLPGWSYAFDSERKAWIVDVCVTPWVETLLAEVYGQADADLERSAGTDRDDDYDPHSPDTDDTLFSHA